MWVLILTYGRGRELISFLGRAEIDGPTDEDDNQNCWYNISLIISC